MNQSSKSRYFLVELLVNCLLFAVSAAVCVAILVHANMAGKKVQRFPRPFLRRKMWRKA